MSLPHFLHETRLHRLGHGRIAGVDEAGRGPLAGPVVAAAVILDPRRIPEGLNDSKKLTRRRREQVFVQIMELTDVGIGEASVEEIDRINILQASHLAMERALAALDPGADFVLIDGHMIPRRLNLPSQPIIRGDAEALSIAAASIVAKVRRDQIMVALAQQHPGYGWENNVGYPTQFHKAALLELGVTPHHRRSFAPIHNILCQDASISC